MDKSIERIDSGPEHQDRTIDHKGEDAGTFEKLMQIVREGDASASVPFALMTDWSNWVNGAKNTKREMTLAEVLIDACDIRSAPSGKTLMQFALNAANSSDPSISEEASVIVESLAAAWVNSYTDEVVK